MLEISWQAEQLLASQEGMCTILLISWLYVDVNSQQNLVFEHQVSLNVVSLFFYVLIAYQENVY
jgi:hypothetical protein